MNFLRRCLWLFIALLVVAGLLLRWRAPHLLFHGRPVLTWLGLAALTLLGFRCLVMAFEAFKERLPWTRLLIPFVIFFEGLGLTWKGGASPFWQNLRLGTTALLEVSLLLFAIRIWVRRKPDSTLLPEDELAKPISAFLPAVSARLIALELVMVGGALRFMFGGHRNADPAGHSYTQRCVLGGLLVAIPVLIIADLVALEFLLQGWPKLRWLIHLSDAYAILWFTGLWASFRARPHGIVGDHVTLHHGILGRMNLKLDQIVSVSTPPVFKDDWGRLADNRKVIQLQAPGPPLLDLHLSEPLAAMGFLGLGKPKSRVRIAVDDPETFKAALGF